MTKKGLIKLNIAVFTGLFLIAVTINGLFEQNLTKNTKNLNINQDTEKIEKIKALELFFEGFNSPLKPHAGKFVEVADRYEMDYRILPAIACMESSCGQKLIEGSYNPFGWGIYGNNAIYFASYDEAIEVVGKGIKENYIEKGLTTPEKIAPVYTPPNHYNWLSGVRYFINKIDAYQIVNEGLKGIALEA